MRTGIKADKKILFQKAQVIIETLLALVLLVLFIAGAMVVLRSVTLLGD